MDKWFHRLRWILMTFFFAFFVWGAHWLGYKVKNVLVPVLACGISRDIPIGEVCYYLSHLGELPMAYGWVDGLKFIFITILVCIIFGRTLCSFMCPMGYFQEIAFEVRRILKVDGFTRKEKFMEIIKVTKYLLLLAFFGMYFISFDFCDICPAILTIEGFAGWSPKIVVGYLFGVLFLALCFFMRRFWCNICPMGYFIGLFHKISLFKLKKDGEACTKCGACYEACPQKIKSIYTEMDKDDVTTADCIFCGECIRECPEDNALSIYCGPIRIYTAKRSDFMKSQEKVLHKCSSCHAACHKRRS